MSSSRDISQVPAANPFFSCAPSGAQDKTEAGLQAETVKLSHLEGLTLTDTGAAGLMTHTEALDMTDPGEFLSAAHIVGPLHIGTMWLDSIIHNM